MDLSALLAREGIQADVPMFFIRREGQYVPLHLPFRVYMRDGFTAATRGQELKVPGLELMLLVSSAFHSWKTDSGTWGKSEGLRRFNFGLRRA